MNTVLVVDDRPDARESMTRPLAAAGFDVRETATGRDALRLARLQVDAILLDLVLPDMDGFDVLRALKADPATGDIPVILKTAAYLEDGHRAAWTGSRRRRLFRGALRPAVAGGCRSPTAHRAPRTTTEPNRVMPVEIEAFLGAYAPKLICLKCLAAVTSREEANVRSTVQMLLAERRAETQVGECLNCNATEFVVRHRVR